jgi:hypothetical protein
MSHRFRLGEYNSAPLRPWLVRDNQDLSKAVKVSGGPRKSRDDTGPVRMIETTSKCSFLMVVSQDVIATAPQSAPRVRLAQPPPDGAIERT